MEKFNEYYDKFLKEKLLTKEAPTGYSTGLQGKPKQSPEPMQMKVGGVDVTYDKGTNTATASAKIGNTDVTMKGSGKTGDVDATASAKSSDGSSMSFAGSTNSSRPNAISFTDKKGTSITASDDDNDAWVSVKGAPVKRLSQMSKKELQMMSKEFSMRDLINKIDEARIDDPDVDYVEIERPKGNITKVIAKLASYKGGGWTRLNKEYTKLVEETRELEKKTRDFNVKITDKIQNETFDPADELYTRVVETKDALFTLTKAYTQTRSSIDRKGIIENMPQELYERLDFVTEKMIPELTQAIALIIEAYTTTKELPVKPGLSAKLKEPEEKNESITEDTRMDKLATSMNKFLDNYDKKLDYITNL